MKKQRICIIGDGLSGLTSALALKNLQNIELDLILNDTKKFGDSRTTAISESNFKFLKTIIKNFDSKLFWPSKNIQLFFETSNKQFNFLNFEEGEKKLMYVCENKKFKSLLLREIKLKKIKTFKKKVNNLNVLKNYDLIILCLGTKSPLYNKVTNGRTISKDYKELALTGQIQTNLKFMKAGQYFLKDGPLAILPFSKNKFSFVWTISKDLFQSKSKNIKNFTEKKIKDILKINENIKIKHLKSYPIKLNLETKYFNDNLLVLGDGLHRVHPVAGQGFNLVLRDIKQLKEIINYYSVLGIQFDTSQILNEFTKNRKPENILLSLGIDVTRSFFKKNNYLDPVKKIFLKNLNRIPYLKKISLKISDTGLNFN